MNKDTLQSLLQFDKEHIWHPYSSMTNPQPMQLVESAAGVYIHLATGEKLIDGMASWWSVIHGYNHPELNQALVEQTEKMAHVMFGGLTHEPAIKLCQKLVELSPEGLTKVFLSDSGSVSVDVAMKMAIQYWQAKNKPSKHQFLSLRNGYHGDTLGSMSVCDPVTGMHHLFADVMMQQHFTESPSVKFSEVFDEACLEDLKAKLETLHESLAALIVEPIVQGAGGMKFYHPDYLKAARELCDQYDVLLITDEIATGFGRTGELFACQHAGIAPDIMTLGKTLTGGYITLAATLTTDEVADTISNGEAGCFMHGPTFMANPLACAVANKHIELLQSFDWQSKVKSIETQLKSELLEAASYSAVADVRILGAIGVIELHQSVDMPSITQSFIEQGVWLRPFGKLVYIMPPYSITETELSTLTSAMKTVVKAL
ncbi:MAG: adenosylmethionine--8-amino-7-oxononanoate transaminase [Pseudomonadales bacterium]|nr:adenosylmethionine--8-amino-7-oxononanoate transaminase [Pseudomonadales bacterium]